MIFVYMFSGFEIIIKRTACLFIQLNILWRINIVKLDTKMIETFVKLFFVVLCLQFFTQYH